MNARTAALLAEYQDDQEFYAADDACADAQTIDPYGYAGLPLDDEDTWDYCFVCSRPTNHVGEHNALVAAGLATYDEGIVSRAAAWDADLARRIGNAEYITTYGAGWDVSDADVAEARALLATHGGLAAA